VPPMVAPLTIVTVPVLVTPPEKFSVLTTLFRSAPEFVTGQPTIVGFRVPADLRMVP